MKITKDLLRERGYKCFDIRSDPTTHGEELYQKVLRDDEGKKYWIDFYYYDIPGVDEDVFEGQTDLYREGTGCIDTEMRVTFFGKDLDEIEKKCEGLWEWNGRGYYEKEEEA